MKKTITIIITGLLVLTWVGCSSVRVAVQYDKDVDFSQYSTFYFSKPRMKTQQGRNSTKNPLFTKDMMNEIRPVMEEKGFSEAPSRNEADMVVIFYAHIQNRRDWVSPTYRVGRRGRVWRTRPGHMVNYKEGTLVIDIVDWKEKELIWQGVGKDVLNRSNPAEGLLDAVAEVLEEFPPNN